MRKAPIALLALALLSSLSCGKRTPPQAPKERVNQRVELTGFQRGDQIVLSWKMPARNAEKSSVLNIDRIDIYRLAEPASSSLTMSEEEFASQSTIIATLSIKSTDFGLQTLSYPDKLEFAGQPVRLRYSMRFANASGQKAAFSNFFLIEPASKTAAGPTSLSANYSQDSIDLKWLGARVNIDGSSPANLLGYNVYRSTSEKDPAKLLNKTPVAENTFRDEFFDFGKEYFYFVRAVSIGTDATPIESRESNILKLKPVDTFPPSPPSAITLAVGQNVISLFFAVNPEKDIAGYRIYRSTNPDLAKKDWTLLTPEILSANTLQDTKVESGKTYYYYLTATDKAGNVSEPSEIVSETVK
ncbi:MAG: hypothetical protein ABJA02_03730 [Acidobacteriota bacterium]